MQRGLKVFLLCLLGVLAVPPSQCKEDWKISDEKKTSLPVKESLNAKRIERFIYFGLFPNSFLCLNAKRIESSKNSGLSPWDLLLVSMQRGLKGYPSNKRGSGGDFSSQCKEDWKSWKRSWSHRTLSIVSMQRGLKDKIKEDTRDYYDYKSQCKEDWKTI